MKRIKNIGNIGIIVTILCLSGCATKRALVLNNKIGPTIELREVKRGIFLSHGGIGSERNEWQVLFRLNRWQMQYSITEHTPIELVGITPHFQQGEITFSEGRKTLDVNLKVRTVRGNELWEKNGRYLVETYGSPLKPVGE